MSTPKKGFDPLASLFDLPESPPARPDPAPAPVVEPEPPPPPVKAVAQTSAPGPDPVQLAKILAKAAAAKAAASAPPKPAPPKAAPPPKAVAPQRPAAPKAKPAPSLAARLAPPPKKQLSAEEALAAARNEEDDRRAAESAKRDSDAQKAAAAKAIFQTARAAAARPAPPPVAVRADQLGDLVAGIVGTAAPEMGPVYIANAVMMDDRGVLSGLWRAHRARFAARGDLDGAVACGAVIKALTVVPIGQLVAAHAVTDKTDWLVWIDLVAGTPIAAFRDARAWFGQG